MNSTDYYHYPTYPASGNAEPIWFHAISLAITAMTLLVNLHQSYHLKTFQSTCCTDDGCFGMTFENSNG